MIELKELEAVHKPHWCPGCGNFGILQALKMAFSELNVERHNVVMASGIGCSSHMPHWVNVYGLHGLHGRPIPVATGIKLANPELTVVAVGGDGDGYGIGVGHLVHTFRRNIDLTYLVSDNQIYGLTKGQTSPASELGFKTKSTPHGSAEEPLNPMMLAISGGATFVARGYAGDLMHLKEIIKQGISHKGFALIDVLQPCVTYNKVNTYQWFQPKVYKLEANGYKPDNKFLAIEKAMEWGEKIPIGVLYKEERPTYEDRMREYLRLPVVKDDISNVDVGPILEKYKSDFPKSLSR